jgi:hypothetical protein
MRLDAREASELLISRIWQSLRRTGVAVDAILKAAAAGTGSWLRVTFVDLGRQFRWSYLPPLMVYFAAGVSGLTAIVGTFFIKDYLGLSAAFLAGLTFWAVIPWALKMPLGHLVDLIWRWKALLVWLGAGLIAASVTIMYALIAHTEAMTTILSAEAWYVMAALLAPSGYVVQDVVADAMTVEAVPQFDENGNRFAEADIKAMHTTMQTLGRFAIISATVAVSVVNVVMFEGVEALTAAEKAAIYADVYLLALIIPAVSVSGIILGSLMRQWRARRLRAQNVEAEKIKAGLFIPSEKVKPNWLILGGSGAFVVFSLATGSARCPMRRRSSLPAPWRSSSS